MNKRIYRKIYKRADKKLMEYIIRNKDKRTTFQVANQENILSALEKRVFNKEQNFWIRLTKELLTEIDKQKG